MQCFVCHSREAAYSCPCLVVREKKETVGPDILISSFANEIRTIGMCRECMKETAKKHRSLINRNWMIFIYVAIGLLGFTLGVLFTPITVKNDLFHPTTLTWVGTALLIAALILLERKVFAPNALLKRSYLLIGKTRTTDAGDEVFYVPLGDFYKSKADFFSANSPIAEMEALIYDKLIKDGSWKQMIAYADTDLIPQMLNAFSIIPNVYPNAQSAPTNHGMLLESQPQATAYWLSRMNMSVKPQFVLYTFDNKDAGEAALLELPFMHRDPGSGKILCDRMMTYGCYAVTENNVPTGKYEVLVCGSDLTLDEYNKAEEAFLRHGGTLRNHDAPSADVKATPANGNASAVSFKEKIVKNGAAYEVYSASSRADAQAFLATKTVTAPQYYIVVDTPEGSFGKDIQGTYQE